MERTNINMSMKEKAEIAKAIKGLERIIETRQKAKGDSVK